MVCMIGKGVVCMMEKGVVCMTIPLERKRTFFTAIHEFYIYLSTLRWLHYN